MTYRRLAALLATLLSAGMLALVTSTTQSAQSAEPQPTVVSITWDDTYSDTLPGLDAMLARNIPGTLYVNSQRVGFSANFMTRAQLKRYADAGFEIGGHTLSHDDLATLSPEAAKANICTDRENLYNLGYRPTSFAYPFGSVNPTIEQMVRECGYNSGRTIGDLKWPQSCFDCATAETIPPVDPFRIRTPSSIRSTFTLDQMKGLVTQAEDSQGGWVPLVFHHVCDGCSSNAVTLADFTAFLDWLQTRPASTTVKTVDSVIGGDFQPISNVDPVPDDDAVIIGTQQHVLAGVNARRCTDCLIEYTRVTGMTTGTNQYGTEVSVVNGKVTAVQNGVGNMAIPSGNGNYVLSGHGESATWLKTWAKIDVAVTLHNAGAPPPPPPPPPPAGCPTPGATSVTVGTKTATISGFDVARKTNFLVVYTPKTGPSTGTNEFGYEAAVVDGKVTQVANSVGNMAIPSNGCVLSGHGTSRTFLQQNAVVGATIQ